MKLAYVINAFPKLSESFVLNEIIELLKNGHDVQIFSIRIPWEEVVHDDVGKYHILERTHYFSFKKILKTNLIRFSKYLICIIIQDVCDIRIFKQAASKAIYEKRLIAHPNKKSQIYIIERFGMFCIHRFILNLKMAYFVTILDKNNVELIHTHFATMGDIARRLSKMLQLPYTLTAHAADIYQNPDADELRKVMDDAESIVTISEYNKKYLSNNIGVSNRIEVVRCGINLNKFHLNRETNVDGIAKILVVARLIEKKGLEYLIKAMPLVIAKIPNCELTIVGSGPLNDFLHQLVNEMVVGKYVQFRGSVPDSELMQCYENTDMFVLPCTIEKNGNQDGIPVAIMEAMAMGLPVISTSVSGIPELVENGVSGLLVQPMDENALADAMIELLDNPDMRHNMGQNARKRIADEFNVEIEVGKQVALWQNNQQNDEKHILF